MPFLARLPLARDLSLQGSKTLIDVQTGVIENAPAHDVRDGARLAVALATHGPAFARNRTEDGGGLLAGRGQPFDPLSCCPACGTLGSRKAFGVVQGASDIKAGLIGEGSRHASPVDFQLGHVADDLSG